MPTIEFCRSEQLRCAAEYHDAGARLGLHDWFAEEYLMEQENKNSYDAFLRDKHVTAPRSGFKPAKEINHNAFQFQKFIIERALDCGKFALFSECGTGKTLMQLEWADHVVGRTSKDVLIVAPLAVAAQTREEGKKFGIDVTVCRTQDDMRRGLNVTNYEMLQHFDASGLGGVVLDESSILKNFTGATKRLAMEMFAATPYKLACTATPAPNDHLELGNHAQFLDVMPSNQMISRWFLNDSMKAGGYRLKAHAERDFWEWVASWSVCIEKPSDIGFSDDGWVMPALNMHQHIVAVDITKGAGGNLYRHADLSATGLHREMRITAPDRAARVAELASCDKAEPWIIWCNTDYEAEEIKKLMPYIMEVSGRDSPAEKERKLMAFSRGEERMILTKPKIAAFGLNWQHCSNMAFVGLSYSYEAIYQAVRRSWRFGQKRDVNAHLVIAETEGPVLETIMAKQAKHLEMKAAMVRAMKTIGGYGSANRPLAYMPTQKTELPKWL